MIGARGFEPPPLCSRSKAGTLGFTLLFNAFGRGRMDGWSMGRIYWELVFEYLLQII